MAGRPRGRRVLRNIKGSVPEIIVLRWEEAFKKEYGYLPFTMSHRVELAILEHIRVMERRLAERDEPGGGGGQPGRGKEIDRDNDEPGHEGPDHWHQEHPSFHVADRWQDYLRTA